MKPAKFSNHIGNIDDRLISQAEDMPDYGRRRRISSIRRTVAIAAVIALMAGSFIIGAVAINKEAEVIYIEEPVYIEVEKEQEIIKVGNSGISLILPDWWKGKYEVESGEQYTVIIHSATRERFEYGGVLFAVSFWDVIRPMDYQWPWPAFTIAITENGTYIFGIPSDVQFDMSDPAIYAEFEALSDDIKNIEIVMTTEMLESSINMSNNIRGTVFVDYLHEEGQVAESLICDAEQSRKVIEIINRQNYYDLYNYDEQLGRYWTDLRIMYDGEEYFISITGRTIYSNTLGAKYAHLSDGDITAILEALNYTPVGWQPNGPVIDPPAPPPLSDEEVGIIWNHVREFLQLALSGDVEELARRISPDGELTDKYLVMAANNIQYYTIWDLREPEMISIVHEGGPEYSYVVNIRDANNNEFYVIALYGEGILGIQYMFGEQ